MQPIFTLDARDNVMLEVMRDYFKLSNPAVRREIQAEHLNLQQLLLAKGINYANLKAGLVPSASHHEAGFIFDTQCIQSSWYGLPVARALLPLLDKRTTQSVLCGDLIRMDQSLLFNILEESLLLSRSMEFVHGSLLYCVYINNLSEAALRSIHTGLAKFPAYVGFIPATFESRAKTYLSHILVHSFLKNGPRIIMGHEDDLPNEENVNIAGYPFDEFGYKVYSLQSMYFDTFLAYKIERAVHDAFKIDTEMALNAVSDHIVSLRECSVLLEDAKHAYLISEKAGKLRKAGIAEIDSEGLAALIKSKIEASYIYNMVFLEEHNVIKFNLMLEVTRPDGRYPTKLTAALEYKPEQKTLRVITLY